MKRDLILVAAIISLFVYVVIEHSCIQELQRLQGETQQALAESDRFDKDCVIVLTEITGLLRRVAELHIISTQPGGRP